MRDDNISYSKQVFGEADREGIDTDEFKEANGKGVYLYFTTYERGVWKKQKK